MRETRTLQLAVAAGAMCVGSAAWAGADAGDADRFASSHFRMNLPGTATAVPAYQVDGRLLSVYGKTMSTGPTAEASAQRFIDEQAGIFGVTPEQLQPGVRYADGASVKGLMYDQATGDYKLQLVRYHQYISNVPVFRSELKLLVRNVPGYPLVQANGNLRNVGKFEVPADAATRLAGGPLRQIATREFGGGAQIIEGPELIIFAGIDLDVEAARLGVRLVVERGTPADMDTYTKVLMIVDPTDGSVLYRESQVLHLTDIEGSVHANTTDLYVPEICAPNSERALPFARVTLGGTTVFADENGDFVIPHGGSDPVTVESRVWGQWFRVFNSAGAESVLSEAVTPPGPVDFLHNLSESQFTTAEVNGYIESQRCRDYVLDLDPDFPIFLSSDMPFSVTVNVSGSCNAFYTGDGTSFFRAGGSCPNEAFSSIVYHEYGHHLVARATGAQCQWGEGNADVTALQVSDEPELAFGFFGNCDSPLRNADNECEYSPSGCSTCGGPCHNCGQLISGCNWSLRNNLLVTEPADYRTIGGQLWLASLFMHSTGQTITPADTINFLMADDDDGDIDNGTPHYFEIANAFADHNMAPPPLTFLEFELPDGAPDRADPSGGDTVRVQVTAALLDPKPDSGVIYISDGAGVFTAYQMTEVGTNLYEGVFPAMTCGTIFDYYFSVDTTTDLTIFFPVAGAEGAFEAIAAIDVIATFTDDFESDLGWTTIDEASAGAWERAIPDPDCSAGDPPTMDVDAEGAGFCFVTDNAESCFSDIDFGTVTLISPVMDASDSEAQITYSRWFSNDQAPAGRDDVFRVEVSDDAGASWSLLEEIGPLGIETEGGWFFKSFRIGDFVDNTDQFQIRFIAQDVGTFSTVEAGVDAVEVRTIVCGDACVEDLDGSGAVDFADILAVLSAWGNLGGPEDIDSSGVVDFADLLAVLSAWGDCP